MALGGSVGLELAEEVRYYHEGFSDTIEVYGVKHLVLGGSLALRSIKVLRYHHSFCPRDTCDIRYLHIEMYRAEYLALSGSTG